MHLCVCVCDVEMEVLSSDRLGDELRLLFIHAITLLQSDVTLFGLVQNNNSQLSLCLAAPFTEGVHDSRF